MTLHDTLTVPATARPGLDRTASHTATSPSEIDERSTLRTPEFLGTKKRSKYLSLSLRVSLPLALALTWWLGTASGWISGSILASPSAVFTAFKEIWRSGDLSDYFVASFGRAATGLAFGLAVGLVLGILSGLSAAGEEIIDTTMQMLRAVPVLALVPLYLAWFGIDEKFKIVLIASAAAIPMYAYAYLGVRSVDRKMVEAARGFGLKGWRLVTGVILPSALPNVLMALRICLVLSMTALISAEGIGTEKGIGYLVLLARQNARTDYTMLCIVLYAGLGLAFDMVIRLIERYSMPWRRFSAVRG
jgi:sulfonate transport system permease protein